MVVRMRHNRSQTRQRRSHHALGTVALTRCQNCNASAMRHRMCANCGQYRGKQLVDVAARRVAKEAKKRKQGQAS